MVASGAKTTREAAEELGMTDKRLRQLLAEGRIVGAQKFGWVWLIPSPVQVLPPERPRGRQPKAPSA